METEPILIIDELRKYLKKALARIDELTKEVDDLRKENAKLAERLRNF